MGLRGGLAGVRGLGAAAVLGVFASLSLPSRAAVACDIGIMRAQGSPLKGLSAQGDLVLGDNAVGRLPGIRLVTAAAFRPALEQALQPFLGKALHPVATGAGVDRWSRQLVGLASGFPHHGDEIALSLLQSGVGLAWPSELPPNCRNLYLQAEEAARTASRGIWAEPAHGAIDAREGAGVAARAGEVVVMQGRVMHVGQTRRASYLNFGARHAGASAQLGLGTWRELERQGWTRDRARGRHVRVRGVASASEGRPARVLVGDAAAIEWLD